MNYDGFTTFGIRIENAVAWVTFDYPPVNIQGLPMLADLNNLAQKLEADNTVKVVVFQSVHPEVFVAHADTNFLKDMSGKAVSRDEVKLLDLQVVLERISKLPQATIAKIEGFARGGGHEFALACDMRFAARGKARFMQMEVGMGILPCGGGASRMARQVGLGRALEIVLGARDFDAEQAEAYGTVNRALDADEIGPYERVMTKSTPSRGAAMHRPFRAIRTFRRARDSATRGDNAMNTKLTLTALTTLVAANSAQAGAGQDGIATDLVLASEVTWEQLNPARGDKSPKAGTLWGDRNGTGPTGFLVQFADGFSSPPHIHNVSYRGVVISGLIHNDDPGAAEMWMPAGSFWTQPKGEVHITAAKGTTNVAYIEIEEGPYLVLPTEEAFDSGERPINVDASNIVWIDQPGISPSAGGPKVSFLWGEPQASQLNGTLTKLPAGFTGKIDSQGSTFRAVVIKGQLQYQMPGETDAKTLEPGSYFSSKGESVHQVSSEGGEESIIYVRADGKYDVIPAK